MGYSIYDKGLRESTVRTVIKQKEKIQMVSKLLCAVIITYTCKLQASQVHLRISAKSPKCLESDLSNSNSDYCGRLPSHSLQSVLHCTVWAALRRL